MKRIPLMIILWIVPVILMTASGAFASQIKMLFFYQDGCHWCVRMEKVIQEPEVKKLLLGSAQVIRINVQGRKKISVLGKTGADIAKEFKVYGTPTIILVGTGEKVLLRIPGALSKADFLDVVCHYLPGVEKKGDCVEKIGAL